ncbi:uncharacterized protein LOC115753855 [Rhodamnia argentea]|uniref:Uncharacterized protein LOC115753855 n=1 Tax=Rhodamnia argentea TaxID=178133 RepID=A0A8B8QNB6_9MYRT|nr:uncharacterized protein LOC115753855 [Rhodamnia argentea]
MGCVSSKHVRKEREREDREHHPRHRHGQAVFNNGGHTSHPVHVPNHVVSLTSSTYGALRLDSDDRVLPPPSPPPPPQQGEATLQSKRLKGGLPARGEEPPEVINAWELMEGLEDGAPAPANQNRKTPSPRPRGLLRGVASIDSKTPLKFLNQIGSPRKANTYGGKENKGSAGNWSNRVTGRSDATPKQALRSNKSLESSCKAAKSLRISTVGIPFGGKRYSFGSDHGVSSRRSLGPLFDPELLDSYEKELSQGEEQIKKMISPSAKIRKKRNFKDPDSVLRAFQQKCPPGGDNVVVIYTTTLRGIRKTFEDCNAVRSAMESHCVQMQERDVSMDSGYKEELRKLTGSKEVKVPMVFVKGKLIGGADEVVKLEEEGKLGVLLDGIPRTSLGCCEGCGGVRFVMCMECSGSCKVFDEEEKKVVKCGECNENGLIHCPICC